MTKPKFKSWNSQWHGADGSLDTTIADVLIDVEYTTIPAIRVGVKSFGEGANCYLSSSDARELSAHLLSLADDLDKKGT